MKKENLLELVEIVEQVVDKKVDEKIAEIRDADRKVKLVTDNRGNLESRFLQERHRREKPFFNSLAGP